MENEIKLFSELLLNTEIRHGTAQSLSLKVGITSIINYLTTCRSKNGTIYVIGNGGSAAIASHVVVDLVNMGKVRAMTLHEPAVATCLANDYGYEHVYSKQLVQFLRDDDVLISISSSGQSKNILNAVHAAKSKYIPVITLSGFLTNNPLRQLGDINLWLNSSDYSYVEIGHAFILHHLTDCLKNINYIGSEHEDISYRRLRV